MIIQFEYFEFILLTNLANYCCYTCTYGGTVGVRDMWFDTISLSFLLSFFRGQGGTAAFSGMSASRSKFPPPFFPIKQHGKIAKSGDDLMQYVRLLCESRRLLWLQDRLPAPTWIISLHSAESRVRLLSFVVDWYAAACTLKNYHNAFFINCQCKKIITHKAVQIMCT